MNEILDLLDEVKEKIPDSTYLGICNKLKQLNEHLTELKQSRVEFSGSDLGDCSVCYGDLDESDVLPDFEEERMSLLTNGNKCKYFEALGPQHRDVWVIKGVNNKFFIKVGFPHQCNHEYLVSPEYETLELALHHGYLWFSDLDDDDEPPPLVGG